MIERMKMVYVVSSAAHKEEMLEGLRSLGILHLSEKKSARRDVSEKVWNLTRTQAALADYAPDKKAAKGQPEPPVLSDSEFQKLYDGVLAALEQKNAKSQDLQAAKTELERIQAWGSFSPQDIKELKKQGYDLHFYRMGKPEFERIQENPDVKLIRLASIEKMYTVATIGPVPGDVPVMEFSLPEKGIEELKSEIALCEQEIAQCEKTLAEAAKHDKSFNAQILKAQNEEEYSSASESAEAESGLVWLSGYVPEADIESFKAAAQEKEWAYAIGDVDEEDQQIPTKMKFGKVSGLISPVFDILGILPGYRESDISFFFLLFFTLFFAMIMGDGGYGIILLIGTIAVAAKTKTKNNAIFLLFVLSIATIAWGAVTGTWFGMEAAMKVPFLKAMVIPGFANYPQYFGVESTAAQNNIIKFSFSIGAIQMAIGSLISVKKKIGEKNLSFVADIGWLISVVAMYLLSLFLVINEPINIKPVFILIGVSFAMVVIFGGMGPGISIADGLKAGAADAFTVFLNTISCFGNVMSYIRLFAVGMAGLAISQSFNGLGGGFKGPLMIAGAIIVIIGHVLNLVMCVLSVVVHGVRLNVLEFSGQAGLEWTGIAYEPFKVNEKIKK